MVVNEDKCKGKRIMEPMGLLTWIVVGAIAGWLAGIVMRSGGGALTDIVVGIIGALIAGFLFSRIAIPSITGFSIWSVFVAFTGAVGLLAIIHRVNRRGVTN
jgi:uncharacterized membrane protein YeaQ/YmgE (transglycosylase-associated protein family)